MLASAPADDVAIAIERALAGDRAGLPPEVVTHLVRSYGAEFDSLIRMVRDNPALGARVEEDSPVIAAQLSRAVRGEMAVTVEDLINRRTELGSTARATARSHAAAAAALAPAAPVSG